MRRAIHAGSSARPTARASISTPAFCSATNHFACNCVRSSLGRITSVTVSSGGRAASRCSASPPSLPGLPDGMRTSSTFSEANSDTLLIASASCDQSKPASTVSTSRSR